MLNLGCGEQFHPAWENIDFQSHSAGVKAHDLRKPLPFPDESCAVVYHSHVLEHFSRALAPVFLKECHRVLIPGGILRVVVPDLETIARLYLTNLEAACAGHAEAAKRYEWIVLELFDQMVREKPGGEMLSYWKQNPMPAEDFVIERMGREVINFLKPFRENSNVQNEKVEAIPTAAEIIAFRETGEIHQWMYDRFSLKQLMTRCGFVDVTVCSANQSSIANFTSYSLDTNPDGSVRKPDSLFMEARKKVNF